MRWFKSAVAVLACAVALAVFMRPGLAAAAPKAELVSGMTADHVLLHGLLYTPEHPTHTVVIHIPGGPGSFYSIQDMAPLAASLNANGYAFLSFNMRSAGNNGILFTRFEDYFADVQTAMSLAKARGYTDVILLGHSLGTARIAYFYSKTKDPSVKAMVFSGVIVSTYGESQLRWNAEERARYDAFLAQQRAALQAGQGRRLATYQWSGGHDFEMSAQTWVSIFGTPAESDASVVKFAKDITVPVLLVHATKDEAAWPANVPIVMDSLVNSPSKTLVWVEGANHLFIGDADKYAKIVTDWLVKAVPARQP